MRRFATLVAVRDATNLRRSFDMVLGKPQLSRLTGEIFWGHPVRNRDGAFDHDATPGETFWGARGKASLASSPSPANAEFFNLSRTRSKAVFQDAVGHEQRCTYGLRFGGTAAGIDYAVQAALQRGEVTSCRISAHGVARDFGYSSGWRLQPRFGEGSLVRSQGAKRRLRFAADLSA